MFGELPEKVEQGDWLRVPFSGHPLANVEIKIGDGEWVPCYHDQGDVMIRRPSLRPGSHKVSVRSDSGQEQTLGTMVIPGDVGGGKSSVRVKKS